MKQYIPSDIDTNSYEYVIADDHPSVTLAVSQMLAELLGVPALRLKTTHSTTLLLDICAQTAPVQKVVVLDLVMPGEFKRVALVRALLGIDPKLRLLVYTADESPFLAQAVIDNGAVGFVAKTSPVTELLDSVVAVSCGQVHVDKRIDLKSIEMHPWNSLTESEKAVLVSLCRGLKAADIVTITGRSYSTVTTHKYNGLSKLGLRDGSELLPYIYINGLLHELDENVDDL